MFALFAGVEHAEAKVQTTAAVSTEKIEAKVLRLNTDPSVSQWAIA